jgi:hypothetical protein
MATIDRCAGVGPLLLPAAAVAVGVAALFATGKWLERAGPAGAGKAHPRIEVEQETRGVIDRATRKRIVVEALIAGRLTLVQAAGRFRALNRAGPPFSWRWFREAYPGGSDEERHCREVIARVEIELEGADPCLALPLRRALLGELESRRGPKSSDERGDGCGVRVAGE